MRRALPLLLALLVAPAVSAAKTEEPRIVFVEEASTYGLEGDLVAGESRAFRFRVLEENVTRVAFHLRWEGAATLSLEASDPEGREVAPPTVSSDGDAALSSGPISALPGPLPPEEARGVRSLAGQGEWRVRVHAEEAPEGARVPFALTVVVVRAEPVTVRPVTLQGEGFLESATRGPGGAWSLLLLAMALLALVAGVAAAGRRRAPFPPTGDNTPSSAAGQGSCAPRR